MDDFLKQVLTDGAVIAILFGMLSLFIRRWVTEAVSHHFMILLEGEKAVLEIEKRKKLSLFRKRTAIYPEIIELIYRLRNGLRDCCESLKEIEKKNRKMPMPGYLRVGEGLFLLTENLYKYRAFIDEDMFLMLHRYKRILQDAQVLLDRLDRPLERKAFVNYEEWEAEYYKTAMERYRESSGQLEEIYQEVDKLYLCITERAKQYIAGDLT